MPGDEPVFLLSPLSELASGAALVQGFSKPLAMPFEERDRRLCFR